MGWSINATTDLITFTSAPANGAAIVVKEIAHGGQNDTDLWSFGAWGEAYGYPAEVEFFADRLVFAGTPTQPQTLWLSKIGEYNNFGRVAPIVDDDSIAATLNARQVNAVRELIPLDRLILLTSGGEWKTIGGVDDVLTPNTVGFKPQSYWGAHALRGLVIGQTGLFVQSGGQIVRDIGYQFESDGYTGNDLTVHSAHLFEGKTIVDWAYQQAPLSIVWMALDDGSLVALTYMREQEVIALTPQDTDGAVESVACVREGTEDALYLAVQRTINGEDVRYIERMASRTFEHVRDAFFVDCGLSFDGRNAGATTMTLTGAGWTVDDTLTLTASVAEFAAGDVGDWIVYDYGEALPVRLEITGFTSSTVVSVVPHVDVPAAFRNAVLTDWAWARDVFSGADHLEGEDVVALADGFVVEDLVVADGSVTLDTHAVVMHLGKPYTSDFETLALADGGEGRARMKLVKAVALIVHKTRNLRAGPSFADDDLVELEPRSETETMYEPPALLSQLVEMTVPGTWNANGNVCVRQALPLPLEILGVLPRFEGGQ